MFAIFVFTLFFVCVRPLISLHLCSLMLSPGEECPEAESAPAVQAKWKPFYSHQWNRCAYWFSLSTRFLLHWLVWAVWQAPRAAALLSSEKLHLFSFPPKHGQVISLRLYQKPSKSQLCSPLRGIIYCLTNLWAAALLGRGSQLEHPSQMATPWLNLGG